MKKKFTLIAALLGISAVGYGMSFYAGQHGAPESERDLKWSTCSWGDNINFETKPLPSKPGPNDSASSRFGHFILNIDVDVNVATLGCGDGSENISTGRTIKIKRDMGLSMPTYNGGESLIKYKNCNVEVGGAFASTLWHEAKGVGIGKLHLIDTKMTVKGDMTTLIPANPIIQNSDRAGNVVVVEGGTKLIFLGGAVLDSLFKDDPSQWIFKFVITESDGKVPSISFAKRAEFDGCDVEINLSTNIKAGKYVLLEFGDRKSGIGKPNRFIVNENSYNFGDEIKIGSKVAKITLGGSPTSKDTRTPNDILLEVK